MMTKLLSLCNVFRWHSEDQLQLRPKWPQNTTSLPWGFQPITAHNASHCLSVTLSTRPSDWQAPDIPVFLFLHCHSNAVFTTLLHKQDREGSGKVTQISQICMHTNLQSCTATLTHTNTHNVISSVYITQLTFVGYTQAVMNRQGS